MVAVGGEGGRGFVIEGDEWRYVVTAAHCLPHLPTPHPWAGDTRTWRVLAPLGANKPTVIAECVFVDPVVDIAVLGTPGAQDVSGEYDDFIRQNPAALPLGALLPKMRAELDGWLLALDGAPFRCKLEYVEDGALWVMNATQPIVGGMSGSPILADGVVSCASDGTNKGGPMPRPDAHLPAWLLRKMGRLTRVPSRLTAEAKKNLRWLKARGTIRACRSLNRRRTSPVCWSTAA